MRASSHLSTRILKLCLALVLAVAISACRDDAVDPGPENFGVPAPGTRLLDAAGLAALTEVGEDGTFSFATSSPVLAELSVGNVLVVDVSSRTPDGALVKVDGIVRDGAGVTLHTSPAGLGDAFESYRVGFKGTVQPADLTAQQTGLTFALNLTAGSGTNRAELTGSLSVRQSVDVDFELKKLPSVGIEEASLSISAGESLLANILGQGSLEFDERVSLATIRLAPIQIPLPTPLGVVPVHIQPQVVIDAGFAGGIDGTVQASVLQEAGITVGVGYHDGEFGGFSDAEHNFEFEPPVFGGSAGVKATAGVRLELLVYGLAGPHAGAEAFIQLSGSADDPPPCITGALVAGVSANVGFSALGIGRYSAELPIESFRLAGYDSCGGSASPAITWARALGRDGSNGERARAVIEASDGTYLVAGNSARFGVANTVGQSVWVMRLDTIGNVIWQRAYSLGGIVNFNDARAIVEVDDGFVIVASLVAFKIDWGGNLVWARRYSGESPFSIKSAAPAGDGGVVMVGMYGPGAQEAWMMKVAGNGTITWSRTYNYGAASRFNRVRATSDGSFIVSGYVSDRGGDVLLTKIDGNGNRVWSGRYDNRYDRNRSETAPLYILSTDTGIDAIEVGGGGLYAVLAQTYGSFPIPEAPGGTGHYATWLFYVDDTGEIVGPDPQTIRVPEEGSFGMPSTMVVLASGQQLVFGRSALSGAHLNENEHVMMLRPGGTVTQFGAFSGNTSVHSGPIATDPGATAYATSDGGVIMAATTNVFSGSDQFWIVKMGPVGNINIPQHYGGQASHYENEHFQVSTSTSLLPPVGAPMSSTPITPPTESTEYGGSWQKR